MWLIFASVGGTTRPSDLPRTAKASATPRSPPIARQSWRVDAELASNLQCIVPDRGGQSEPVAHRLFLCPVTAFARHVDFRHARSLARGFQLGQIRGDAPPVRRGISEGCGVDGNKQMPTAALALARRDRLRDAEFDALLGS
jgi:hypothetical protein